jgi:hypothetical protein
MPEIVVPFGQLATDQPPFGGGDVIVARNVIPRTRSYGPFRALVTVSSNALTARARGAISARDANSTVFVYSGDATKLYELPLGGVWTDESLAAYTAIDEDNWEFALWNENNKIIATNYRDAVQSITIGKGTTENFANMITTPASDAPKFKHIGIVHRFVVGGWTNDVDGENPSRIRWSGIADETDFAPSSATQSDLEDLATGGSISRIIGGTEYGLIFQDSMVRTMRYVGAGPVFELFPIEYAPGTPIPGSVVAHKGAAFYISEDGFMSIINGQVQPIGSDRIDRYFWDQFAIADRRYVTAAIDPPNKIVAWAFPGTGKSTLPNRVLMCKYDENKWAEAVIDTEVLLNTATQGETLDGLDASVGTDIDNATLFPESFDSDRWKGGQYRFGAINHSHKLGHFTGATLAATIDTGDMQLIPGFRSQVNGVVPLMDAGTANVSVASRQRLKDSVSYGSAAALNQSGVCPVRGSGVYHRFRLSLTSSTSWSHVQGLKLQFEGPLGVR